MSAARIEITLQLPDGTRVQVAVQGNDNENAHYILPKASEAATKHLQDLVKNQATPKS